MRVHNRRWQMKCVRMCIIQQIQWDMNTHANHFHPASKCRLLSLIDIHVTSFLGVFSPEEKGSYIMNVSTLKPVFWRTNNECFTQGVLLLWLLWLPELITFLLEENNVPWLFLGKCWHDYHNENKKKCDGNPKTNGKNCWKSCISGCVCSSFEVIFFIALISLKNIFHLLI